MTKLRSDGYTNGAPARAAKTRRRTFSRTAVGVLASIGRPRAAVGTARAKARTSCPEDEVSSLGQIAHPLDSCYTYLGRLSQLSSIGGMFDHSGHPPAARENGDHVSPIAATATSALPQLSAGNGSHCRALQ